jgi:hypothetical protein
MFGNESVFKLITFKWIFCYNFEMPEKPIQTIHAGKYRHAEGLLYSVLGLAKVSMTPIASTRYSPLGTALSVAGYEETHEVSGHPLEVFRLKTNKNVVACVSDGTFVCPDEVVVYRQLEKGAAYPLGQLWWRPIENFTKHFKQIDK